MVPASRGLGHVLAVDGLRAVAVLAIIIYHLEAAWLPGGFVGVDVFFVISGFVVANSVALAPNEKLSTFFLWFYRRRFLRILPALVLFVSVTILFSILFIPLASVSRFIEITGVSSLLGLSNILIYLKAGDYFAAATTFNPFTHTWSLAIEEQYYLVFPFFAYYLLVNPRVTDKGRKALAWALGLVCLASLALCAVAMQHDKAAAFYMLPMRFWELGLGFFLFYALKDSHSNHPVKRLIERLNRYSLLTYVSVAVLILALVISDEAHFPFPWAIPACIATAGLLAGVVSPQGNAIKSALTLPIMVYIGKLSYSLYLWHWGVIVMMRWTIGIDSIELKSLAVILMSALAALSYYLVEKPIRFNEGLLKLSLPKFYAASLGALGLVSILSGILYINKTKIGLFASRDTEVWSPDTRVKPQPGDCSVTTKEEKFGGGDILNFTAENCENRKNLKIFVLGDSHAGAYKRMFNQLALSNGYTIRLYNFGACKLLNHFDSLIPEKCLSFTQSSLSEITALSRTGDVLFLPGLYMPRFRDVWEGDVLRTDQLDLKPQVSDYIASQKAYELLKPLTQKGVRVIIEAPKPLVKSAQFRCADAFNRISAYCSVDPNTPREELKLRRSRVLAYQNQLVRKDPHIEIWDPFDILCPNKMCNGYKGVKPLYYDTDHLSAFGNDLLYPEFKKTLDSSEP
jgi:peptidoglycan/LPS O-acetylase OafA/YrhL